MTLLIPHSTTTRLGPTRQHDPVAKPTAARAVRFDRKTLDARVIEGIPESHFVSAIAGGDGGAWVAWSQKEYGGGKYEVTTWLAWVRD